MAELTLNWPVGTYSRVKSPAGSGATLAESTTAYWEFVREGAVTEVGAPQLLCSVQAAGQ